MSKSYFVVGYYRNSQFLNQKFKSLKLAVDFYQQQVESDSGLADFDVVCKDKKTGKRYSCNI